MTIHVSPCKRLRVYEEPNGSFGTDHSGTMGDFLDVPFREGSMSVKLLEPTESPQHTQQHIDGYPEEVIMPRRWELSFSIGLEALATRAASTVQASQGALGRLLKIFLGGEHLGTGTTVNDGSATTTEIDLTSAAGFSKGGAIGFATGTGGALEFREIKNISSNTVTLKHALSGAPSNGSVAYSCATYYLNSGDGDTVTSAQFAYEGLEQDDRFLLRGGQLSSMAMELSNGGLPAVTFTVRGAYWAYADGSSTAGTLTGAALGTSTYVHNTPVVIKDSELRVFTNGTTSISSTLLPASAYEFTPNISYAEVMTPAGLENVLQFVRTRSVPVIAGSFTIPYEAQTWFTARASRTDRCVALQIGSTTTSGGVLLTAPTVQITDVQKADAGGIDSQKVDWKGRRDADVTSPTTEIHGSAMRIHLF